MADRRTEPHEREPKIAPEVDQRVSEARSELDRLLAAVSRVGTDPALSSATAILSTTLEELEVTAEELRAQNDELIATRAEVERAHRRYRDLFLHAPEAYLITDENGLIREANHQAEQLLGRPTGGLDGKPLVLFVPEEDRARLRRQLRRVADLRVRGLEMRILGPEGEPLVVTATVEPVIGRDGSIELRWVLVDATPGLLVRRHLAEMLDDSRSKVEVLETVQSWQSTLLGAAAHDLRSPLGVVMGVFATLQRSSLDGTQEDLVRAGYQQAAKLQRTLEGLLELGRRRLDVDRAHRQVVAVGEVVQRVVDSIAGVPQTIEVDADVEANVDPTQLERIVENLVSNAVRHAPPESRIRIVGTIDSGDLHLTVDDEGPGVPDELREDIFLPFVGAERPGDAASSGLGLAIVSMFAAMHGGSVHVTDGPRGGASFTVILADVQAEVASGD